MKSLYMFIKNILGYAKYVFKNKDFDFDYFYLLRLIDWKLGKMHDSMVNIGDAERVKRQINYARLLISRITGDYLDKKYDKLIEEACGESDLAFGHKWAKDRGYFVPEECKKGRAIFAVYKSAVSESDYKVLSELDRDLRNAQELELERLYDRLFRHLRKYIRNWWD